ncbi:DNA-binding protein [Corynebacterium kutscheri]|uniref:DNA-binding ferritin-like protein (Oxidative damage protectant) n=1 Tax=Corynebacterium kutscheri TaxID=35755 RepID=A0A0F6QZL9_9CORY|nr:DNA starvation/stationary phase protection protein Dps [Corynebacterium kutscheri]AKE40800.1 DNA-binding ferritin-like protein (oxidative damage protectant) [Corynebacterium kutscheri]VEH04474.1 DNA-binding protein [Corynebacterium kutscheri]VEH09097.1 DNA-binding protein [Corynebacterium kutscheri]VEH80324.1 DNA-binding protein [Corynebacterium kutscheri]
MSYTVPGLNENDAKKLIDSLQERLTDYNDLHLILKHAHWNVVGHNFIAVHEMIDPQVDLVRGYADELAERIATLGGSPIGTPAGHVADRTPLQYQTNRGTAQDHLKELDRVYTEVLEKVRESQGEAGELDAMTEDLYIAQAQEMEKFQWFVRAHLDDGQGNI